MFTFSLEEFIHILGTQTKELVGKLGLGLGAGKVFFKDVGFACLCVVGPCGLLSSFLPQPDSND